MTGTFVDFYNGTFGIPIEIDGSYNVYQYYTQLGSYSPPSNFSFGGAAVVSYDNNGQYTFVGVPSGVVLIDPSDFSYGQFSDGSYNSSYQIYSFQIPGTMGIYEKVTGLSAGDFVQFGSSPYYQYPGGEYMIDASNGWPPSNVFAAPPQTMYVNGIAYALSTIGPTSGPNIIMSTSFTRIRIPARKSDSIVS